MVTRNLERVPMQALKGTQRFLADDAMEEHGRRGARREAACRRWRTLSLALLLCCLCLVVGIVLVAVLGQSSKAPTCPKACTVSRSEYINAPLTPFSELTADEVKTVLQYFATNHTAFRLTGVTKAKMGDNFIHLMEAVVPPKAQVLDYLEGRGPMPGRTARIVIFRGNATPPVVEEYELPLSVRPLRARVVQTESRKTRVPYSMRPFSRVEFREVFGRLMGLVMKSLGQVLKESYGATLGPGCKAKCLRLTMTPISSVFLPHDNRAAWFWLAYDVEFFTLHPLDLQFLVNTTSTNSLDWTVEKVYYADQYFDNFEDLARRYNEGNINKTRESFPELPEKEPYSALHLRGDPFPEDGRPPPVSVLPQGNRFMVTGTHVSYMRWHFTLRVSPTIGLQLFDVKFGGERIAYEISVQEIAVLYAGYTPASSILFFADSAGLFGTRMRGMLEGEDCPSHAVYLDTQMFTSNDGGLKRFTRALCLFEHNREVALRRHRAYSMSGAFYGGLSDTVLVLRAFVSLINYDYILDYKFHANGAVEVSISSTGYLATSYYVSPEERYGTRINQHVTAGMHQHLFHVKADLDVAGTRNDFSTWDVNLERKADTWARDPTTSHTQTYIAKTLKRRESEACYHYNFTTPKYLLVSGGNVSDLGHRRSYRVLARGMSPPLLPPEDGFEPSVPWARCQVAVTRHKDSEAASSSIYAMWDARDPVVNFTSYMADDESIEDQDLVTWVTLGTYHIPHLENTPNTATVGTTLSLYLTPFNFFPSDPSMASRDAVRASPLDPNRPLEGAFIERYNSSTSLTCLPGIDLPDDELKEAGKDLFS
ncbi:putative amine oxidase [copper-containing] [Babylonia areolata]|uniref:putative amine oxidase [copper-containing] n=1 Tax=Babylonia areolata TaxID=304850 RepID=UPI003FD394B6